MREIKFRAWDGKRMTTSGIMFNCSTGELETPIGAQMKIMQFTGLKDKKGKEIYEGDIVNQFDLIVRRTVIYINGAFGYYDTDERYKQFISFAQNQWDNWDNCQSNDVKMIGNIYENPELINNTKIK